MEFSNDVYKSVCAVAVTDAPTVHFKYLKRKLPLQGLWHMPTSGACYLDLYAFDHSVQSWRHVAPIAPTGGTPFYDLTSATTGGLRQLITGVKLHLYPVPPLKTRFL